MTVIRDTDFTPSHIIEFYTSYHVGYLIVSMRSFMIIPNVGPNERTHTFWLMEELFVAPLHCGLVFFSVG